MAKKITKAHAARIEAMFFQWNHAQQTLRELRPKTDPGSKEQVAHALEASKQAWDVLFDEFGIAITRENA